MTTPFLRLDFGNSDESKVQFETIIATLSGDRQTMNGDFAAVSITDQHSVGGPVVLKLHKAVLDINLS